MTRARVPALLLFLLSGALALDATRAMAQAAGEEDEEAAEFRDPDGNARKRLTSEDVKRWMPVDERELHCPFPAFRDLAQQVAEGTTDLRVLRAYARLYPRLYPFDHAPSIDGLLKAASQRAALERSACAQNALPAPGFWVPLGPGNIPGRTVGIAFSPTDPDTVFAIGADGGLWKTADAGVSWTAMTDHEPVLAMGAVGVDPVDPNTIYLGTGEGNYAGDNLGGIGVLKTSDGGLSWTPYPVGGATSSFHTLVVDPTNRASIWAATRAGLFHSTDAAVTWNPAGGGLPAIDATDVLLSLLPASNVLLAGINNTAASVPENGIWRSTDRGTSWAIVPSVPAGGTSGRIVLAQSRSNPSRMYAAVADRTSRRTKGVYRSDDEGATWTQITTPGGNTFCARQCWYDMALAVDAANPDVVYAAGLDTWRSLDGGTTWGVTSNWTADFIAPNYTHADHHAAFSPAANEIWVTNDGGISRSFDRGDNWSLVGRPITTAQYYHISADPTGTGYALAGAQDNGTQRFIGSTDWSEVIGGDGFFTAIDWNDPTTWYGSLYNVDLYRSVDRGQSFSSIGGGISGTDVRPFLTRFFLDRSQPRTVFALTNRLWKSTDRGDNFVDVSAGTVFPAANGYLSAFDNCRDVGSTMYVGTNNGSVWITEDGGGLWTNVTTGLPGRFITSISVHPSLPHTAYVTAGGATPGEHVYRTTDGGQTWTSVSAGLPDIQFNQVLVLEDIPTTLLAAADIGAFVSIDEGVTWTTLGQDLPNVAVDWLAYSSLTGRVFAATHGRGAWELVPADTCALRPLFAGLESVVPTDVAGLCEPLLTWQPARSLCALGPGIHYNVYRSTDPFFTPGPGALLVSGLTATSYTDTTALSGVAYYYIVRAEDGQTGFPGPTNGGQEDQNEHEILIELGDPIAAAAFADDGGDTDAWLRSSTWSITNAGNTTPGGRASYRSVPFGASAYRTNSCASLETADMVIGAGATLSYQASWNLEDRWDGVVVEISTDGGGSWLDLPPDAGYPSDMSATQGNSCNFPSTRPVFSGPGGNGARTPFAPFTSDLAAYAGQTARIRWLLSSDAGAEFDGFLLDDVSVSPVSTPVGGGTCATCVPGLATTVEPNSLLVVKSGGDGVFLWRSVDPTGRWNLHTTTSRTALATLSANALSVVARATTPTPPPLNPFPAGFYQVFGADACTGASAP